MLTCIACTKQVEESGGEDGARGTPTAKDAVKSLTSQIKDIALKFSGVYKQSKPSAGSSSSKGPRTCPDFETIAQGLHYPYVEGGSSTNRFGPTSDFPRINRHHQPPPASQSGLPGSRGGGDDLAPESISDVVLLDGDDDEPKEWVAQVEPGVQITFLSLPQGGNDLKRIRFSREMFNKWEAQRWWGENYDRVMELYNVQRFNRQALPTPLRSEDERDSSYSRIGSSRESPVTPPLSKEQLQRNFYNRPVTGKGHFPSDSSEYSQHNSTVPSIYGVAAKGERSSVDASRTTTSSRDEASISISNASDLETEWVEQDEPGVYITIRALHDGTRELRRVRFSRERFGEMHAKLWWEQNRERIQARYL